MIQRSNHLNLEQEIWVEINDESKRKYDISNTRFKISMIRSNLCDYSDAYIFVKATVAVPNTAAAGAAGNNTNKKVLFKNCALFTDCITKRNNTQVDDAQAIYMVIPMYNYNDAYSKTSGSLWQYYRDESALDHCDDIDFPANNNNSASFKFKQQIIRQTGNGATKDVGIMVPLKYLSNFWRAIEMPLTNCDYNIMIYVINSIDQPS